jgi:hypothetical protein
MSGNPGDFSFSAGLPYDDETSTASTGRANPRLDFALDDYPTQRHGRDRAPEERPEREERPANLYRECSSSLARAVSASEGREVSSRAELTLFVRTPVWMISPVRDATKDQTQDGT